VVRAIQLAKATSIGLCLLFLAGFWFGQFTHKEPVHQRKLVRFWHPASGDAEDLINKQVAAFNASQDEYEVQALSVGSHENTKFVLGVLGRDSPDVLLEIHQVLPQWVESHLLCPLDSLMTDQERDLIKKDVYPVAKRIGMFRGHLYGMPGGFDIAVVYYRPQDLRAAGLPDRAPQSLEELTEIGKRLTIVDKSGQIRRLGWYPVPWYTSWLSVYGSLFGGGIYDWDHDRVTIDTPQNLRSLQYLYDFGNGVGFGRISRFQSGLSEPVESLIAGKYSFLVDGPWLIEGLKKHAPNFEYRTCPIPAPAGGVPRASYSQGGFYVIPTNAKQKTGAMKFIEFAVGLTNPRFAAKTATTGGLPMSPLVVLTPEFQTLINQNPQYKTLVDLLTSPKIDAPWPIPYNLFLQDQITRYEDLVERGESTPKEALENIRSAVTHELARRKELGYHD